MKKIFFIVLLFCSLNAFAQTKQKIDSIYYLLDTVKIPVNDRIWEIGVEGNFKYYTILCPCLAYGLQPTFFYRMDFGGQIINNTNLRTVKFISISSLILKAKKFTDSSFKGKYAIFFIEGKEKEFISHKVSLRPAKKPEILIDYENITAPDSKKQKKSQ
ncbi:MAG: hypothetical protein ACHQIM_18620 [Sphingobacteriales bacterium]